MNTGSTTPEAGAVRFSRRVIWTMATRLLIAASSIVAGAIVARWLGPSGVGVLAALGVVTLLAINVGALGLPSSLTLRVAQQPGSPKPLIVNAACFGLLSSTLLAIAIVVVARSYPGLLGDVPLGLLTIAVAALPIQMLSYMWMAIYLGLERIRTYNLIDVTLQGILLLNAFVTLVVLGLGLSRLVIVGTVANVLAGIAITLMLARDAQVSGDSWRFDSTLMRETLSTGLRFWVALVACLVILRADLLLVNYFRGASEAGVYAVSTQIATFLHMMPNVISTLLFPRVAATGDETGELTCRVTRHAVFIVLILCVLAVPAAFLLSMIYGPGFSDVPFQFMILLPGVFLLAIETVQVQHFTGRGLPRIIPAFWVGVLILNIGLNLLLVPRFGGYGAAASSSISYAVIFVLVAAYFRAHTGTSVWRMFMISRSEMRALAASLRVNTSFRGNEAA